MFERFTAEARGVVVEAKSQAEARGHSSVTTEHLLSVLVDHTGVAGRVLIQAGLTRTVLDDFLGIDRAALEYLGIDLEQVLSRTRAMFPDQSARLPLRGIRFAAESKKALELALREAIRLQHRHIGAEHIMLGILRDQDNRACRLMVKRDISPASLRTSLETEIRAAS
ncbi:MAG: Clp protease N-terminal domain-containing protein [Acidimicrobiia bacterium]|nr:Clp protease [Acidimicrobiia bacterium]MDQ3499746.1 Clp protease [Actinomycetota bacterium]